MGEMLRGRQAIATPGVDIPHGTDLAQPRMAGEAPLALAVDNTGKDRPYSEKLCHIANRLETLAGEQVTAKQYVERRWLESVRAFHGLYPRKFITDLEAAGQSTAFVKATRAKTVALEARLYDLMFPTDDRNWGIQPTPVPKLAHEKREAELRATNAADQANQAEAANDPRAAQIVAEGNDEASRARAAAGEIATATQAAKLMQEEMDDQLVESHYPAECRDAIHDMCLLGSAILKGPMVNEKTRGRWLPQEGSPGGFVLNQMDDVRPMVLRVDPWNFFPDMSARRISECEFTFERYLWTKTDLRRAVTKQGFDPDAVRELLRDDRDNTGKGKRRPATNASLTNLITLRSLTEESTGSITGRYVGWEYHGPLECEEVCDILYAMGEDELAKQYEEDDDPLREIRVIIHFCEGCILKIAPEWPMDSGETLYSLANLEDAEGQLFGYGVPTIMNDSQIALNSAWRMALDNGALSVGPQAFINKDQIMPADGDWTFRPKKIWHGVKAALANAPDPIKFFDVPNNMEEIAQLIQIAETFIDMETGIPQPQQGEQGTTTTQTVGGMAILQNSSNIIFRRVVKNVDDGLITPTMRRLYDWNMQFNKKAELKGDMQVDARGTSVLLVKEVQASNLMLIVTTLMANPDIKAMLKTNGYPSVVKLFQAMMIKPDEVMNTEDDYKKYLADAQKQPPPEAPQVEVAKINAQARAESDKMQLQIAQLRERTAMIDLATKGQLKLEELRTILTSKQLDNEHKERMMVGEAAIERQNTREARAHGEQPEGSGGYFSEGEASASQ
jgi:hypothetical protein